MKVFMIAVFTSIREIVTVIKDVFINLYKKYK